MYDVEVCCEDCLKEGILRRFIYYPMHMIARVQRLEKEEHCMICKGAGGKYAISIQMNSLNLEKAQKEREQTLEARRNASDIKRGIKG